MLPIRFKLDLCIFQILGRPHKEYGDLLLDEILCNVYNLKKKNLTRTSV